MTLDVGELVARLTMDDSRFTQGAQRAEQASRRVGEAATEAAREVQQATQTQARAYQTATRELERNESAARTARERSATATEARQRAEQRLRDAQQSSSASADDLAAAERQVEQARSAATRAADRAQSATDTLESSQRRAAAAAGVLEEAQRRASQATSDLTDSLGDVGGAAGEAGGEAGGNFLSGFTDMLGDLGSKTGPVAGSILGIAALGLGAGVALANAIKDGMQDELRRDLFQGQTGTTVAQAEKFARAAGEAYADVFGESVEENLSTLKLALQNNILDPGATQRDAEKVVAQLETISTALDSEVSTSVKAVSALMSTGLAASAEEAADMIANAVGGSANKDEDLLEVIWEYAAGWKNAGISAEQALALIEQSTDAGAWNADVASDALREFGRRVSEEGEAMVEGMNSIGLNGQEMFDALAAGGEEGSEAFDQLFDKIRSIEDPALRNEAILAVLGDTAGDFFDVFSQWDPSEALNNFGEFEGASGRLAAILGGNEATSVEGAMRAVSVVADGLKAALAEAFGPQIAEWADQISNNRAGVIQFFIDVGNAAFDGAEAVLGFVSQGMRGLAEFADAGTDMSVSFLRSLADMIDGLSFLDSIPGFSALIPDMGDASDKLDRLADAAERGGEGIASGLRTGADFIDNTLIPGVDAAQGRFNDFAGDMKLSAAFNDESAKVSKAISDIGVQADGSLAQIENWTGKLDSAVPIQAKMHEQLNGLKGALLEQTRAGLEAGATVEELTATYGANRDSLIQQAMQMGLTSKQAVELINQYGLVPELVDTQINTPGMPEAQYALDVLKGKVIDVPDEKSVHTEALTEDAVADLEALGYKVETLLDGTVIVTADTEDGQTSIEEFIRRNQGRNVQMYVDIQSRRRAAGVDPNFSGPTIWDSGANTPAASGTSAGGSFGGGGRSASGGFADGGVRQRANGALDDLAQPIIKNGSGNGVLARTPLGPVRYAEGETGWEAYIPGALSKRPRSERILQEVAKRFGFGLIRTVRGEAGKIFKGDPKSLDAQSDPTGWRALLGGDYSGRSARFGIQEDHPLVDVILSMRKAIAEGDYDGHLAKYGIEEDHPLSDFLLGLNKQLFPAMADGGVVESLRAIGAKHAPALQVTSDYRAGDSGHHGSGNAVDFSNGSGNTDEQLAFANYLADNYQGQLAELIYDDPRFDRQIKDGKIVDRSFYAGAGDHTHHVHAAAREPLALDPGTTGQDRVDTRTDRERNIDAVIAEGKRRGMSDKAIRSAVATMLAESDGRNLANPNDPESLNFQHESLGYDHDSSGVFQQRNNGAWGTAEDRMDPAKAAGMFYDEYTRKNGDSMSEAEAAQAVQQSATRDGSNYAAKLDEADKVIAESNTRGQGADYAVGTTSSGATLMTDGQRVFVTNWPTTLEPSTAKAEEKPAEERTPILTAGLKVFENGGINGLPDQATVAPDGANLVNWAERGTGGEVFTPLHPSKRARSVAITKWTANKFGFELVPMADGGLTGFGGYIGDQGPTFDVPLTPEGWAGMSANKRRATMASLAGLGVGGAFALASGFDENGRFTGQFDTGANSHPALEKGFQVLVEKLEEIRQAAQNPDPVDVQVDIDSGSRTAQIEMTKRGL